MYFQVEELKKKGNAELNHDPDKAVSYYSEAIQLDADNHILYGNRACAYCKCYLYNEALADAEVAIRLKPDYAKVKLHNLD